jgi:two-component system chemotaxis response regulator CheB
VIAQHMQSSFIARFAASLSQATALEVREAAGGEVLQAGYAYLAPGHANLGGNVTPSGVMLDLIAHSAGSLYTPSVDVLFHSVAQTLGAQTVGVLLTGMGKDGAAGLLAMRRAGAWTIAQAQSSSVVWGMPREAVALEAADVVLPLPGIASHLCERLSLRR